MEAARRIIAPALLAALLASFPAPALADTGQGASGSVSLSYTVDQAPAGVSVEPAGDTVQAAAPEADGGPAAAGAAVLTGDGLAVAAGVAAVLAAAAGAVALAGCRKEGGIE